MQTTFIAEGRQVTPTPARALVLVHAVPGVIAARDIRAPVGHESSEMNRGRCIAD